MGVSTGAEEAGVVGAVKVAPTGERGRPRGA